MVNESVEKCATCRFSGKRYMDTLDGKRHEIGGSHLACWLNPPMWVLDYAFSEPRSDVKFPFVHQEDWCGQYQAILSISST